MADHTAYGGETLTVFVIISLSQGHHMDKSSFIVLPGNVMHLQLAVEEVYLYSVAFIQTID